MIKEEVITNIKDILIELEDIRYKVDAYFHRENIEVIISRGDRTSWWSKNVEYRDKEQYIFHNVTWHLDNYLKDEGYSLISTNYNDESGKLGNAVKYTYKAIILEKINKKRYIKNMENNRRKSKRRVKKFSGFRKSVNKPFKFTSVASSPIPGPMSIGSGTSNIDIVSNTSN